MTDLFSLLGNSPALAGGVVFLLGLCIGSFLNVVVYRLPVMMERRWKAECGEINGIEAPEQEPFNLAVPASRCPSCGHQIRAWENIPILSFLFLRGRCSGCGTAISWRYPMIELISGLLAVAILWRVGADVWLPAWLLFGWILLALALIDIDTQYLPDDLTLPLLWLGLLANLIWGFVPLEQAVIGAVAGYLVLWSVYWGFKLLTGKEGMGYGDFKLLAALGAWYGWTALPWLILLSAGAGTVAGLAYMLIRRQSLPFAFGPYLVLAGGLYLFLGADIQRWFLP